MRILSKVVISIPLLAGAWMIGTGTMSAAVQELSVGAAVKLLAKSSAINTNCRYLSDREHGELQDYVAKAEVAAASAIGPKRASKAVHTGTAAGNAAACGDDSKVTVRATLDAARRAIAAAGHFTDGNNPTAQVQPATNGLAGTSVRYS
ncbi:MAG: hypothetical protein ACR2OM_09160, partial [Aestuariivirgaceae bacterium]